MAKRSSRTKRITRKSGSHTSRTKRPQKATVRENGTPTSRRSERLRRILGALVPNQNPARVSLPVKVSTNYRGKTKVHVASPVSVPPMLRRQAAHKPTTHLSPPVAHARPGTKPGASRAKRTVSSHSLIDEADSRRKPRATCKERPQTNRSKGGGSKQFIPWCNRR